MTTSILTEVRSHSHELWGPVLFSLLLFSLSVLVLAIPGAFLFFLLFYFSSPIVSTVVATLILAAIVGGFWRRHWMSGGAMIIGILVVAFAMTVPVPVVPISRKAADVLDVLLYYQVLQTQLQDQRKNNISPSIAAIPIDGFGSTTNGIAYDPTGEILLPATRRSKSWIATAGKSEIGMDEVEARHILGNYYSWSHD